MHRFQPNSVKANQCSKRLVFLVTTCVALGSAGAANIAAAEPSRVSLALISQPPLKAGNVSNDRFSKLPSLSCEFSEPFITIITSPEGIWRSSDETGALEPQSIKGTVRLKGSLTSKLTISATLVDGSPIELVLKKEPGSDGMSDVETSHSCSTGLLVGAGSIFPNGYVARTVVNVAADDVLNVRAKPNALAEIVAVQANDRRIWIKPSHSKWKKVAFAQSPTSQTGRERIVTGWANTDFISERTT
jgi:hypothetical protein